MTADADIFLSYSRDDQAVARHFAEGFERAGFSVWWDVTLKSGEDYDQATEHALRGAKAVVVLWSKKSVASRWVRTEATIALQSKTLVPVMIEPCQRPIMFELTQTAELGHWQGDEADNVWRTFVSDVQRFVQKGAASSAPAAENLSATLSSTESPTVARSAKAVEVAKAKQPASAKSAQPAAMRSGWLVAAVATLVATLLAFPALQYLRQAAPTLPPETRVDIVTPATDAPAEFTLSPDGRQLVFVAAGDSGVPQLWLRSLATTTAQPLTGTEGAAAPFWSPDSRAIGFFAGGALKRLDVGGTAAQTLAPANTARGASWSKDNIILFPTQNNGSLQRIAATGGEMTLVTSLEPQQQSHRYPHFLPDGRRFLFYIQGAPGVSGIYLGNLDGSTPVQLTVADSAGIFLPSGWLLWVRAGTLTAQRFDLEQAALTGNLVTLAVGVVDNSVNLSGISVAATGLIAYRTGAASRLQLTWVDRAGTVLGTVGELDGNMSSPRVSPDGRLVTIHRGTQNNQDLWLLDGARTSRLTFDPAGDNFAEWSPDSSSVVFRSNRAAAGDIYRKQISGDGTEQLLVGVGQPTTPSSWSADGRFLLYNASGPETNTDLWILPMTGNATPIMFLQTPFRESWGSFAPDGRWVAYQSDESGRSEVYVRAFTAPDGAVPATIGVGGKSQVSTEGGAFPTWGPDGKELYYLDVAGNMIAASVTVTGDTLTVGTPALLFPTRINGGGADTGPGRQYDVSRDGRFLINTLLDDVDAPITLIQNWNPDVAP